MIGALKIATIAVIGGVKTPVNVNFLEGGGKCLKRLMSVSVRESVPPGSKYLWSTSYVPGTVLEPYKWNPHLLHLAGSSLPLSYQGSSSYMQS